MNSLTSGPLSKAPYAFETQAGTLQDTYLKLYGPTSSTALLDLDDDSGIGEAARIDRVLMPGRYWLRASAGSPNTTGTYTIRMAQKTVTTTTVNDSPVYERISWPNDVVWVAFTVTDPGIHTMTAQGGTLRDTFLTLSDSTGKDIATDDNSGNDGLSASIEADLPAGVYYLAARPAQDGPMGTLTMMITR